MTHIVVCVKQVPDSREIRVDPISNSLIRQGVPSIVNYYDLHGLEEALRLKDRFGARVTVITMGPAMAERALRECISLGADEAVLVTDKAFAGADTLATSYVLAQAIGKASAVWGEADIVFCGKQTIDGDTGQVGPGIACRLNMEQLTYVNGIVQADMGKRIIRVQRQLEDGLEIVETRLPALLTIMKETNTVRRASLPGMVRAARYKPIVWTSADFDGLDKGSLGLKGSPTTVGKTWVPERANVQTEMLTGGNAAELSRELVSRLSDSGLAKRIGLTKETAGEAAAIRG